MAARGGRRRRAPAGADARRAPRPARRRSRGDDGVRRQRSRAVRAAAGQPALADRGGGDGTLAWRAVHDAARGGVPGCRRGRRRVRGARSRGRGRGGAALRTEPARRRGARGSMRPGVRDERGSAAASARLPAPPRRPGVVRNDQRQVALVDQRDRGAVHGIPGRVRVPIPAERGRGRTPGHSNAAAVVDGAAGSARLPDARSSRRAGTGDARGARLVRPGAGRSRRGERRRGGTWADATLTRELDDPWAWCGWTFSWEPRVEGAFTLCCRATDETGETQPLEPQWNLGGYENNAVQRVQVVVR